MKRIFTAARSIAIVLGTTTFFKAYNGSLPTVIVSYPANTGLQCQQVSARCGGRQYGKIASATCPYHIQRGGKTGINKKPSVKDGFCVGGS